MYGYYVHIPAHDPINQTMTAHDTYIRAETSDAIRAGGRGGGVGETRAATCAAAHHLVLALTSCRGQDCGIAVLSLRVVVEARAHHHALPYTQRDFVTPRCGSATPPGSNGEAQI